jgi:hypothetical protein
VLSPMATVFVLAVLWLIVVVPMVVRRNDQRRRERSVTRFRRAMRTLGGRPVAAGVDRTEVFVPRERRAAAPATPARRPVPVAQEALMYPIDRSEMSAARAQMMARRRRSLGLLVLGSVGFGAVATIMGGVAWLLAAPFLLGLVGYLSFLRSQSRRDRERRLIRQQRAAERRMTDYDATADLGRLEIPTDSVVRIDDDDLELHNLDTVDLTGLYNEETAEAPAQRRAS